MTDLIERILERHKVRDLLPDAKLRKDGRNLRGACPLCGSSDGFMLDPRDKWHCFACNEHGDVIDLYQRLNNVTKRQALVALGGGIVSRPVTREEISDKIADADRAKQGRYVLACVRCPATLELADELEAALALAMAGHAQNWQVAPDGIAALCPRH